MSEDDNGGQAFPTPETNECLGKKGMSLRDYMAGQALAGLLSKDLEQDEDSNNLAKWAIMSSFPRSPAKTARISYEMADAMIKRREL